MIILISDDNQRPDELAYVSWFLEDGLDRFHLRRPAQNASQRIKDLTRFPGECHPKISIHGDFSWSIPDVPRVAVGAHKTAHDSWDYLTAAPCKSASFHSIDEYLNCPIELDYAFLSPIYASISKSNYAPSAELLQDLGRIQQIPKNCPLIALGGVNFSNLAEIKAMGFDGIALKGCIWGDENPAEAFQKIRDQWYKL